MKLSKAQAEVLEDAKKRIDFARSNSFFDWYMPTASNYIVKNIHTPDELDDYLSSRIGRGGFTMKELSMANYEMLRNGIDYLCHANSKTILKLEELGLIEVLKDSNGEHYGLDVIKILNY